MYRRLWSNPNFGFLWVGQAVSAIGDYFTLLAIPLYVNRLTGSVLLVGFSFIIALHHRICYTDFNYPT